MKCIRFWKNSTCEEFMIAKRGPTPADRLADRYWRLRLNLWRWGEDPDIAGGWRRVDNAVCLLAEAIEKQQKTKPEGA